MALNKILGNLLGTNQDIWPYMVGHELGEGQHGAVYLGQHTRTKEQVALKRLPAVLGKDGHWYVTVSSQREIYLLHCLQHHNIVSLKHVIECAGKPLRGCKSAPSTVEESDWVMDRQLAGRTMTVQAHSCVIV